MSPVDTDVTYQQYIIHTMQNNCGCHMVQVYHKISTICNMIYADEKLEDLRDSAATMDNFMACFGVYLMGTIFSIPSIQLLCRQDIILWHSLFLEYIHKNQTNNRFDLKWQFIFRNAPENIWVSLKRIIHILTVVIPHTYGLPVPSYLS